MFWFALAGHLSMSVKECQQKVSSFEFAEWIAANRLLNWAQVENLPDEKKFKKSNSIESMYEFLKARYGSN